MATATADSKPKTEEKAPVMVRLTNHTRLPIVWEMGGLVEGEYEPRPGQKAKKALVAAETPPELWSIPGSPIDDHFAVVEPHAYIDVTLEQFQAIEKLPFFRAPKAQPHGPSQWKDDLPEPSKHGYLDTGHVTARRLDGDL